MAQSPTANHGTAAERTALAWERTSVAEVALAAVMVRAGIVTHELALAITIATLLVLGAGAHWRFGVRAYRRQGHPGTRHRELALAGLAALVLIAALGAAALALES